LDKLANLVTYPDDVIQVKVFYTESERLVRFLCAQDETKFGVFLEAMSQGNKFETALTKAYAGTFTGVDDLERQFKTYATKDADKY
jgi:hypothetical protein